MAKLLSQSDRASLIISITFIICRVRSTLSDYLILHFTCHISGLEGRAKY